MLGILLHQNMKLMSYCENWSSCWSHIGWSKENMFENGCCVHRAFTQSSLFNKHLLCSVKSNAVQSNQFIKQLMKKFAVLIEINADQSKASVYIEDCCDTVLICSSSKSWGWLLCLLQTNAFQSNLLVNQLMKMVAKFVKVLCIQSNLFIK